jgi:hypothetical protein
MAYNNNNASNTEEKKRSVSTKAFHGTAAHSATPCALDVTYYDDMVRLAFSPELPMNAQTENRRYDYENNIMTALTRAKCNELCNLYKTVIRPAIENCEDTQVAVTLAGVNLLQIGTGVTDGVPHPFIAFYKGLDPETLISPKETRIKYEFNTGEYILGYNPETGEFKQRVVTCNEIDLFFNDLENVRNASSNAYVHTDRTVNKYWRDTLDSKLNRIGEKNGLDLSTKPRYGTNGGGGRGSLFDNQTGYNNTPSNSTSVASLDEIESAISAL